jgi:hypothetical protein
VQFALQESPPTTSAASSPRAPDDSLADLLVSVQHLAAPPLPEQSEARRLSVLLADQSRVRARDGAAASEVGVPPSWAEEECASR